MRVALNNVLFAKCIHMGCKLSLFMQKFTFREFHVLLQMCLENVSKNVSWGISMGVSKRVASVFYCNKMVFQFFLLISLCLLYTWLFKSCFEDVLSIF